MADEVTQLIKTKAEPEAKRLLGELESAMASAEQLTELISNELADLHRRKKNRDEMIVHAAAIRHYAKFGSESLMKVEQSAASMLEHAIRWRPPKSS